MRFAHCQMRDGEWTYDESQASCFHDIASLIQLCLRYGLKDAHLLIQTGKAKSLDVAVKQAEECLASGLPRKKWDQMLTAQGADLEAFNRKLALDHTVPAIVEVKAPRAGFVSACNARIIGEVVRDLGGGRLTKESVINYQVGVDGLAKPGEKVGAGSVLARIHAADSASGETMARRLSAAFEISDEQPRYFARVEEIVNPSETS